MTTPDIPYFEPELAGLCESMEAAFAEGEPSAFRSPAEAVADLVAASSGLRGLDLDDGTITFDGDRVGSYRVIDRPEGTFAIERASWCYHDPERNGTATGD